MPKRRKTSRRPIRRRVIRRRRSLKTRRVVKRNSRPTKRSFSLKTPFPDVAYVKLKYTEFLGLAQGTAGVGAVYIFRGNSLFDPNYTGTGAQPYLFDQWAALYNRYTVLGSKINVQFYPNSVTTINTQTIAVCVGPTRTTTSIFTSVGDVANTTNVPYFKSKTTNLEKGSTRLTNYLSSTVPFGIKKSQMMDDDQFAAVVTGNPPTGWYWQLGMSSLTGSELGSMLFKVEITYYVRFNERYLQVGS